MKDIPSQSSSSPYQEARTDPRVYPTNLPTLASLSSSSGLSGVNGMNNDDPSYSQERSSLEYHLAIIEMALDIVNGRPSPNDDTQCCDDDDDDIMDVLMRMSPPPNSQDGDRDDTSNDRRPTNQ